MKEKIITNEKTVLSKNTPKNSDYYKNYINLLNDKIKEKDVHNIGIFAPYGGGKSSLIKNYLDKYYSCRFKKRKVLNISLASFNENITQNEKKQSSKQEEFDNIKNTKKENANSNESYIQDIESSIERGILEQIIFKDNRKKLSKIDRINHNKIKEIIFIIIVIIVFLFSLFVVINGYYYPDNKIYMLLNISENYLRYFLLSLSVSFIILLSVILFYCSRIKLTFKNIETEINTNNNKSILNMFIDEIIYYFSKSRTELVIIEDLDRFNDMTIFSKLREINYIINNSKQVKQKVTFIYAIRDDMFENSTDKSKFFDFTLPYIPFYSIVTARDYISESIKGLSDDYKLKKEFINDISHYIYEMRVLNNIINDYIVYKKLLSKGSNIKVSNEYIFAILTYKNIMPSDYSKFLNNQGILYDLIKKMQECKKDVETYLIAENAKLNNEKKDIIEKTKVSKNQLVCMIIGTLIKFGKNSNNNYFNLNKSNEINGEELGYMYVSHVIYSLDRKQVEQYLGVNIYDYFNYLNKKEGGEIEKIDKEIQDNESIIDKINKNILSIDELTYLYDKVDDSKNIKIVLNKMVMPENEKDEVFRFFYYCIRNKYIDDRSINYLIYHNDVIITNTDRDVEYKIIYDNDVNYDQRVDNPLLIIKDISISALYKKSFLINEIVKTLLNYVGNDNDIIKKKKIFLNHLCSDDKDVYDFLVQFINNQTVLEDDIFKALLQNIYFCEKVLFSPAIFEEIKRQYVVRLVELLISNEDIGIFENQTAKIMIKDFIENDPTPFETFVSNNNNISAFLIFLAKYNFQLININSNKLFNKDYLKIVVNNNNYKVNHNNITFVLKTMYGKQEEEINTKLISCIRSTNNEKLIERMNSFKEIFLNIIISLPYDYSDNNSVIEEILEDEDISIDIKKKLIDKISTPLNISSKIDNSLILDLVNRNIVIGSWNNYLQLNIDDTEKTKYINNNINELSDTELSDINIEKEVVNLDIAQEILRKLCKAFPNKLIVTDCEKFDNLVVLIQEGIVEAKQENFLNANNAKILIELYNKNEQLINFLNQIGFDKEVLLDLINNYSTSALTLEYIRVYQNDILNDHLIGDVKDILINSKIIDLRTDFLTELLKCSNDDEFIILLKKYNSLIKTLGILKEVLENKFNQKNGSKNNNYISFKITDQVKLLAQKISENTILNIEIKARIVKINID